MLTKDKKNQVGILKEMSYNKLLGGEIMISHFLKEDIASILNMNINIEKLQNETVLVTGATGLIGSMVCKALSELSHRNNWNVTIVAMVRNAQKANQVFSDVSENQNIIFLEQDITETIKWDAQLDYIVHTACPTASNTFINQPVDTISAIVTGTMNVLELARAKQCKSVVYLSSMEAYGQVLHENLLKPEDVGYINPLSLRSCYPEGKRMAENACIAYFHQYQVPVKIIRLAQTFGPGIPATDNRVFAQFIRSAVNGEDIVMFTEGGSKRMYLDTMDAVRAVLTVLLQGEDGQVYNAGNPSTYSSIREMAELVIREFGKDNCKLVINRSKDVGQYPPDNMLNLDTKPLQDLGWSPRYELKDMYRRMLATM